MDQKECETKFNEPFPTQAPTQECKFDVTVDSNCDYLTVWAQAVGGLRKKIASIMEFRHEPLNGVTFIRASCETRGEWITSYGSSYVWDKLRERWNLYIICQMTGTAIPVYLHSGGSTEAVFRYSHQKEKSGNPIRVVNAVDSGELVKDALRVSREEKIKQMTVVDKAISELERTKVSLRSIDAMKGVMSAELDLTKQKEPAPEAISPMKILQDMVDKLNVQVAESLSVGGKVKPGYTFGSPCPPLTTAEKVIKKSRSVGMSTTLFTPKYLENQCLLTTAAEFPGQLGLRAHFPNQRSEDE